MENDCIFCKIITGKSPSFKLYEDDLVIVILALPPTAKGHALVIPKIHYENIFETPDDVLARVNIVCKKLASKLKEKLGFKGVNILNASGKAAQQSVFHLHYHIIGREEKDGLDLWFHGEDYSKQIDVEEIYNLLK